MYLHRQLMSLSMIVWKLGWVHFYGICKLRDLKRFNRIAIWRQIDIYRYLFCLFFFCLIKMFKLIFHRPFEADDSIRVCMCVVQIVRAGTMFGTHVHILCTDICSPITHLSRKTKTHSFKSSHLAINTRIEW